MYPCAEEDSGPWSFIINARVIRVECAEESLQLSLCSSSAAHLAHICSIALNLAILIGIANSWFYFILLASVYLILIFYFALYHANPIRQAIRRPTHRALHQTHQVIPYAL